MGWVLLVLLGCGIAIYLLREGIAADPPFTSREEPPPTEEELLQARLDLHRVQRGVDVSLARQEQRREAERVKQAIDEELRS